MTVIVEPSTGREIQHQSLTAAHAWGGSEWIVPGNVDISAAPLGLAGTPLNGASISTSGLDVTIDTFEAFIGGAYVASDDASIAEHTYTAPGQGTRKPLFLGYDLGATDTFIFGPQAEFSATDPKIHVVDVVDDGTAITQTDDRRPLGYTHNRGVFIDGTYDADPNSPLSFSTNIGPHYDQLDFVIYREDQANANEDYHGLRINGLEGFNYHADIYSAYDNTHSYYENANKWKFIAGVGEDPNNGRWSPWCYQVLRVSCPRRIGVPASYPVVSTVEHSSGKNSNRTTQGVYEDDITQITSLELVGAFQESTGFIEVYGRSFSKFDTGYR